MDIKSLIIGVIINKDKKIIIGANFSDQKARDWASSLPPLIVKEKLESNMMTIEGVGYSVDCSVLNIDITNSISDRKGIYLLTDLTNTDKIKVNDTIRLK